MSNITQCVNHQEYAETEFESRTFIYTWKIKNFRLYTSAGIPLVSKSISVNEKSLWEIKINKENHKFDPFLKNSLNEYFNMSVTFYVGVIRDKNISNYYYFVAHIISKEKKYYQAHQKRALDCGSYPSITFNFNIEEELVLDEKNGWLVDGDLTLRFEFSIATGKVINRHQESYFNLDANNKPSFIEFESMLNNKKFSDIKIVIGDKEFYVYKGILATRSPVFAAMFEHEMKESIENVIQVIDIDHKIMEELLRFIYAGKVNNIKSIAKDLLAAADKYEIEELKLQCEKVLVNDLKVGNVSSLLIHAEKYRADILKKSALEFFRLHVKEKFKMKNMKQK